MRTRFTALLLALAVTLGGCTTNDSGDPQVDTKKAGEIAGQIVETAGNLLNDGWNRIKSAEQTIVVANKYSDGYNYHLVSKDGIDYKLQLRTYLTKAEDNPDKVAYDAVTKGQSLTVWAVGSEERIILRIVG